jgi:hypothetical protein
LTRHSPSGFERVRSMPILIFFPLRKIFQD